MQSWTKFRAFTWGRRDDRRCTNCITYVVDRKWIIALVIDRNLAVRLMVSGQIVVHFNGICCSRLQCSPRSAGLSVEWQRVKEWEFVSDWSIADIDWSLSKLATFWSSPPPFNEVLSLFFLAFVQKFLLFWRFTLHTPFWGCWPVFLTDDLKWWKL